MILHDHAPQRAQGGAGVWVLVRENVCPDEKMFVQVGENDVLVRENGVLVSENGNGWAREWLGERECLAR